jgi:hypothetical protein
MRSSYDLSAQVPLLLTAVAERGVRRTWAVVACITLLGTPAYAQNTTAPFDWSSVGRALGKTGSLQPGDVYKVGLPRSDLHVTVRGLVVAPALALGSWVAFRQTDSAQVTVMGDLVLQESEIGPVMSELQKGGIEQTALHNHLLHESPHVFYLHIRGKGDPVKLATAIHAALARTGTPMGVRPIPLPPVSNFDTLPVRQILGRGGKMNGLVYQVSVPRAETITDDGMEVPPAMGTATAINFQPTGPGKVAITGDFVLIGSEVNPVIRALQENGIEVTAIHSHMLDESPRLFFMHFWANGATEGLAKGLRAALDKMNVKAGT